MSLLRVEIAQAIVDLCVGPLLQYRLHHRDIAIEACFGRVRALASRNRRDGHGVHRCRKGSGDGSSRLLDGCAAISFAAARSHADSNRMREES
jgi:hypothetical protein